MSCVTYMGRFRIAKAKETNKYCYPLILPSKKTYHLFIFVLKILTLFYVSLDQSTCPV